MHLQPAVLLVGDERIVIRLCERILAACGFAVLIAGDARDGLDLYHLHRDQIVLVVTDTSMPFMDGVEFTRRLLEINDATKIMIITGHSSDHPFPENVRRSCFFLTKPFRAKDFRNAVDAAVNSGARAEAVAL